MESVTSRTTRTWNILLHGFSHHSDTNSLLETFNSMPLQIHDTSTYNIIVSHFLAQNNLSIAKEFYQKLLESKLHPDKVTYALSIKIKSEASDLEAVEKLFQELDTKDIRHCEEMYKSVGKYFLSVGEFKELNNLESVMKENGVYPSFNYYNR